MIHLVGDINLTDGYFDTGFGVGSRITAGADPFEHLDRKEEDIWIGNFEGVTANTSAKHGIYGKQFIIAPDKLAHIRHLDYYNVANNHVMQHGPEAFREMLHHLETFGCTHFGSNDRRSIEFTHQGKRFCITGFSQRKENFEKQPLYWYNPEYEEIATECQRYSSCDFRIAYVHWGNEFMDRPYSDQIRFAHSLIDTGYDLVVGMHPHLLQGYEDYRGKRIYYSIGNFVFHMPWEPLQYASAIQVEVQNDRIVVGHRYVHIGKNYFPSFVTENEVPAPYRFSYLNTLLDRELSNEEYYRVLRRRARRYKRSNRLAILATLPKFKFSHIACIAKDFLKRHI